MAIDQMLRKCHSLFLCFMRQQRSANDVTNGVNSLRRSSETLLHRNESLFAGFNADSVEPEIGSVRNASHCQKHPIWDLISDSNSIPIGTFAYGARVPGMRPAVKGAIAEPLQLKVVYRLVVEADGTKLQHDFFTTPKP